MTRIEIPGHDAVGIRAENPSPFTLSGTNTWIVGHEPAWVIDPGPDLPEHLEAVSEEIDARGGLGAVLLTHDHHDHSDAVPELIRQFSPVPLAAARGTTSAAPPPTHGPPPLIILGDGDQIGPLHVVAVPGHAPDHVVYLTEDGAAFTGDAVLGEGSVFVAADMAAYLDGLRRLRDLRPDVIAPGHGPLVTDANAKLEEYITHRLDRERRLVAALGQGKRTVEELLDSVWSEVPDYLRIPASWTLAAHLDKLEAQGASLTGVERPERPADLPAF